MPVNITSVKVKNEFRTESVDWLLANIGDKITIELELDVNTYVIASTDNPFILNNTDGLLPTAGTQWITDEAARFTDFKVGDNIILFNYATTTLIGTFPIVEKLDDANIRITGSTGFAPDTVGPDGLISITTPITSIYYKWNFIENSESTSFASKIDGSEQVLYQKDLDASVVTPVSMMFTGNKSYQIGSATIQGAGIDNGLTDGVYNSKFKIIHNTFITPFFLSSQLDGLLNFTAPTYYFNEKCLKGIFDIEALYNYNDPNRIQTIELTEVKGNTGWFNENFNTGITNYSLGSVIYKNNLAVTIPSIELSTDETSIEIIINNTTDTPFSNNNTKFTLNFIRLPDEEADYQLNGNDIIDNFTFDRALQTVGSAPVNGDNYGGDDQVLKDIEGVFISSSQIQINAKIEMSSDVYNLLNNSNEARYLLWVAIQNHTLETKEADKVALYVDTQEFYEDETDDGMITITHKFLRHPFTDVDLDGVSTLSMFPNDEVVGYSRFSVDKTGRLIDDIDLVSAEIKIKAFNTVTLDEFTLESFKLDLSSLPFINTNQYIDFELSRQFHIPSTEIRKKIKIKRRTDLDTGTIYYYDIIYPYLHRWEYWEKLAGVNGDFFDVGEPNTGFNNFWHRYTTLTNWKFTYETKIKATKNGVHLTYKTDTYLDSNDYDTNSDWNPNTIKSYKDSDNTYLNNGGINYILGDESTRIEAEFTKVSGTPNLSNISMVIWIEVFEEGGINGSRRISSVYEYDSDTWFKSTDASKKIVLSLLGNTVKGVCLIDYNQIPLDKKKFKITSRIYEITPDTDSKWFQDGNEFIFQDANTYTFQDQ
jgi:hypothetical protein